MAKAFIVRRGGVGFGGGDAETEEVVLVEDAESLYWQAETTGKVVMFTGDGTGTPFITGGLYKAHMGNLQAIYLPPDMIGMMGGALLEIFAKYDDIELAFENDSTNTIINVPIGTYFRTFLPTNLAIRAQSGHSLECLIIRQWGPLDTRFSIDKHYIDNHPFNLEEVSYGGIIRYLIISEDVQYDTQYGFMAAGEETTKEAGEETTKEAEENA